ncbi:hypothetical protein JST97_18525 [bacterium]|nr:hypothetical protein [bacterium]
MKSQNFPVLLMLIAVVAVLAHFNQAPRQSGLEPVERDLEACLSRLWEQPGQQVKLVPGERNGYQLQAQIHMPRATRLRQQRWNHPFLLFALSRHPQVRVTGLELRENSSQVLIPPTAMNGLLADRIAPRAEGGNEEKASILTGRHLNEVLTGMVEPEETLVLVDALSTSSQAETLKYGKRASWEPLPGPFEYVVCVVSKKAIAEQDWVRFQTRYLAGVRNPRRVVLP